MFLLYSEAINYAVAEVNALQDLLPNITFGFVVLDDCRKKIGVSARALQLLPQEVVGKNSNERDRGQTDDESVLSYGKQYKVVHILTSGNL